jgi:hypothetical protein
MSGTTVPHLIGSFIRRNTVKLHLRQLTEAGRLRLLGAGRGAWYEIG